MPHGPLSNGSKGTKTIFVFMAKILCVLCFVLSPLGYAEVAPIRVKCEAPDYAIELSDPTVGKLSERAPAGISSFKIKQVPMTSIAAPYRVYSVSPMRQRNHKMTNRRYLSIPASLFEGKPIEHFQIFDNEQSLWCEASGVVKPDLIQDDSLVMALALEYKNKLSPDQIHLGVWSSIIKDTLLPPKQARLAKQAANEASGEILKLVQNGSYMVVRGGYILGYVVSYSSSLESSGALYLDVKGQIVANYLGQHRSGSANIP
jgi:hypothetical protein